MVGFHIHGPCRDFPLSMETTDPPWEPPIAGSEVDHLMGSLERLRATFRWKSDGLDRAGLTVQVGTSALTLGGLLKHLAVCEDVTFSWKLSGEPPTAWPAAPEDSDEDWQFTVAQDDTPESLYLMWDEAVERSRASVARALQGGGLDQRAHHSFEDGQHVSLRRLLFDLVEEYGRHTGHADLLREMVDSRVGEDPPSDWRPGKSSPEGEG